MPEEWGALLRDIDGRLRDLSNRVDMSDAAIRNDLALIRKDVEQLRENAVDSVRRVEFAPIKTLVFGGAGLILAAVVTALVALVVR